MTASASATSRVPVRRPAGPPADHRRRRGCSRSSGARDDAPSTEGVTPAAAHRIGRTARAAAGRPAARAGWCSRPTGTAACARCSSSCRRCRIQDPRERPPEQQELADAAHRRFADEHSRLPRLAATSGLPAGAAEGLSGSAFRRMCRAEYLHYLRIREWQDLHQPAPTGGQAAPGSTSPRAASAGRRAIDAGRRCTSALLPGLLSHVGVPGRARSASTSARGAPGSRSSPGPALFRKPPQLGDGRRAGRDDPAVGPRRRAGSTRSGPSSWASTW